MNETGALLLRSWPGWGQLPPSIFEIEIVSAVGRLGDCVDAMVEDACCFVWRPVQGLIPERRVERPGAAYSAN